MRSIAPIVLLCFLLTDAASAEGERIERIILDLPEAETEVTIEEDRIYGLSTATTSIELEGRLVSIYRWILSAGDTGRVSVRLIEGRWDQVENAGFPLFTRPLLQVHSPQVWGQVRVVLLDLFPWRTVNERLEVLKGARVEVTIRHQPEDLLIEADRQPHLSARIANRLLVMAKQPTKPPLRRPTSFLPEAGTWLKIPIKVDGLYRVTGSYLSDAGIALSALEPDRLRLFAPTSLGRPMPDNVGAPLLDNLKELAIFIRDGDDGKMDADDDILLYGQGPRGFNFNNGELTFIQNPYTNEACVWLYIPETGDEPSGQRMAQGAAYSASASVIAAGRSCYHHEVDVFNGFQSGPKWHQEAIKKDSPFRLTLPTPGLRSSDTTYLRVRLRGGNDKGYHQVTLALNQNLILTSPSWSTHSEITLAPHPDAVATAVWTGQNAITLTNITTNPDPQEEVWFDWAEIEYGLDLSADEDLLTFLIGPQGEPVTIQLADFTAPPLVADITDPAQPVLQQVHQADNHWPFTITDLSTTRRYIAATEAKFRTPAPAILYQNLDFTTLRRPEHQADYIIITDPTLLNAAEDLARIHAEEVRPELRLTTLTTTVGEIYEEFSGGVADPLAIRAFLRWAHENWQQPGPRLVLLFGDGDYDYRNLSGLSRILVPTIQVDGSDQTWSRAVDDAFVYLDATPVSSPLPDMGVGRIAVSTPAEAAVIVEMVRTYMVQPEPGPWRQRVLLAADDPVRPNDNEPAFIAQTETLARLLPPYLQVQKIYLTEYTKVLDPATNSVIKPDATADLIRSVNQGVVLINYVGHGSATQWAQEQLLKMERDRILLQPRARLAVWFAGTCAWGRFDQLEISSMSEVLTASTEYAAIGVVSAVRAVGATANFNFIRDLFAATFPNRQPSPLRIGQILQGSKTPGPTSEKFHLFGDPAILIAFPREPLTLSALSPDTLKVLGTASYSGSTSNSSITTGECLVTVLDAPRQVSRQYQSLNGVFHSIGYTLPGAPIFRGAATITNSTFQGQFVVPKDINYSSYPATIIAYGWSEVDGSLKEQIGYRDDLIIHGTEQAVPDSTGPLITLYWENRPLFSGDALPEGAPIEVELKDPLGINLIGEVGHAIRIWVDIESSAEIMDPLFQYDRDSYTTGRFPYQFDPTVTGRHVFYVEAWDGANNKAVSATTLHLVLEEALDVTDLYNYPNPFQNYTEFVYTLSVPATVTITIYTLNGVKVTTLESLGEQTSGFQRLPWDGRDAFGDQIANGAYLYLFQAETFDGTTVTEWRRLARLR